MYHITIYIFLRKVTLSIKKYIILLLNAIIIVIKYEVIINNNITVNIDITIAINITINNNSNVNSLLLNTITSRF